MNNPTLSIVVLNWNTSDLLNDALRSIVVTAGTITFEVFVVDNASTDGGFDHIDAELKNDTRFTFIQQERNIGWPAINFMLKRATGRYLMTLDPDALLHEGALQHLVSFMEQHREAGAAVATLLNPDGSLQLYYRRIMTPILCFYTTLLGRGIDKYFFKLAFFRYYRYADLNTQRISEVEQPPWPCLIWRREAIEEYIVDENLPFYFLDVEMSKRIYNRGYKIFLVPDAKVTHRKSTSYNKQAEIWRRREYYRSLNYYLKKYYPFASYVIRPLLVFDRALRFCARALFGKEPLR